MTADRVELLKWLIDRSDRTRANYGNRAYNILTADAAMFAAVVFLIRETGPVQGSWAKLPIIALLVASTVLVLGSLVCAVIASSGPYTPSTKFDFKGAPERLFFNYRATFRRFEDFDKGLESFGAVTEDQHSAAAFHELLVIYRIQEFRYKYLRRSGKLLLLAATAITLTIIGMASTEFFLPRVQQTNSPVVSTGQQSNAPVLPPQSVSPPKTVDKEQRSTPKTASPGATTRPQSSPR
jgi:hypothetical protein